MFASLKKFFDFCPSENRKKFYLSIVLGVIEALFSALRIPAIWVVVNAVLTDTVSTKTIWTVVGLMALSVLASGILGSKSSMLQTEGGYGTCADKRMEIAEHMRYIPMGYFNENSLGKITSVTTNTMQNLENIATRVVMLVLNGILEAALITCMLLFFDYRIALLLAVCLIIYLFVNQKMMQFSSKIAPEKDQADEGLINEIMEYLQGITEVKTYGIYGEKSRKLNAMIDQNEMINTKMELGFVPFMTLQSLILKLTGVLMCFASILFYLNGTMTLANCIVMMVASYIIYSSLETAGSFSSLLRTVEICVDKAEAILLIQEMDIEGEDMTPENHNISVENISFAYDQRKIIDNVSLTIPEKTTCAFVGPSGGGKTTLTSLVSRFWDVDEGSIKLADRDVKDYSMDALMKNYSFVFQDVYLFHDTIANNIRFCNPEADMEAVREAAKKACCDEFIMALPDGYETVIEENGSNLSGGERQRISIARAMMKDAPIVILDEATANVDPENEAELIKAIDALTKEKTIIMIAHRLKTVEHADQIFVIDHGKIAQHGTHKELLKEEGIYKTFIQSRQEANSWNIKG